MGHHDKALKSCLLIAQNNRKALQQEADQSTPDISLKEQLLCLYISHAEEADLTSTYPTSHTRSLFSIL